MVISPVARGQWFTQIYGPHVLTAQGENTGEPDPQVSESSGVISSRTSADIFWTHNDSGAAFPRAWAFRLSAADRTAGAARRLGYVQITGASNVDWEDIAAGPGNTIYIFDGGDNPPCDRTDKRIHRFAEPTVDPNGAAIALTLPFDSIHFEYPSSANPSLPASTSTDRYDAECLLVHPTTGDIYVVTKRTTGNAAANRVYKLPAASITWNSATVHVLQFVIDLTSVLGNGTVTGGDADAFGRRIVIRNYSSAYEFTLPEGQSFDTIFSQTPVSLAMSSEIQGESICYDQGGQGGNLISTSEIQAIGPQRIPFYISPWQLANTRAISVHTTRATIRWDTASALASTVNYGTTTSYGQTATNASAVTSHMIPLSGLLSNTKYYYRVTSGSFVYPAPANAATVFFTTHSFIAPDFDHDGDVDQSDFAFLQTCYSGASIAQNLPACSAARLDDDSDVDSDDTAYFLNCTSGANVIADPNCEP